MVLDEDFEVASEVSGVLVVTTKLASGLPAVEAVHGVFYCCPIVMIDHG